MLSILVNLGGLILIAFIVWWFWLGKKSKAQTVKNDVVDITVGGGIYEPALINASVGKEFTLRFTRNDASPCAEAVVFAELGRNLDLPLKKPQSLSLTVEKAGEYEFTCPMGMYRGKLVVS